MNIQLSNFKINDDVSIVTELEHHYKAHEYLKYKGYELLKGRNKKGLGL